MAETQRHQGRDDTSGMDIIVRQVAAKYPAPELAASAINEFRDAVAEQRTPACLDEASRDVVVAALYGWLFERQGYLEGVPKTDPDHDDCCDTARARNAEWNRQRDALAAEVEHARSVIALFEDGPEPT